MRGSGQGSVREPQDPVQAGRVRDFADRDDECDTVAAATALACIPVTIVAIALAARPF